MRLIGVVVVVLLGVSACGPFLLAESASTVVTDKTVSDHLVSWSSGKNCSSVRVQLGQTYCEEDELNPTPTVFCYRTLGNITCYDRPDPHHGRHRQVGEPDQNP